MRSSRATSGSFRAGLGHLSMSRVLHADYVPGTVRGASRSGRPFLDTALMEKPPARTAQGDLGAVTGQSATSYLDGKLSLGTWWMGAWIIPWRLQEAT